MQLTNIKQISGQLELVTGLHIGAGSEEIHIGGIDNGVIKHPYTQQPYIPGSSLKGKMRSLLEWRAGLVGESSGNPTSIDLIEKLTGDKKTQATAIVQLFGASGNSKNTQLAENIGSTRLSFWDCTLNKDWAEKVDKNNWLYTEAKSENTINRISGTADNPRQTERVPAGAIFDFKLTFKVLDTSDEELLPMILAGLKLLEIDGIGGAGSRGYGKLCWQSLRLNGSDLQTEYQATDPFK